MPLLSRLARITGIGLVAALLWGHPGGAAGVSELHPGWNQVSGVATETVFLRRGPRHTVSVGGMPALTSGDLIRTRPFLHTDTASMTVFTRAGTGDRIEIYPGSILALDGEAVRLDLGRMRLVASGGAGLMADIRRGLVELPEGELLVQTEPAGDVTVVLVRGSGWIKMEDRMIRKLSPGKQYNILKYGIPGRPVEAGRMWDGPPAFWILPRPESAPPPEPPDDDDETESASGPEDIASETETLASGVEPIVNLATESADAPGSADSTPAAALATLSPDLPIVPAAPATLPADLPPAISPNPASGTPLVATDTAAPKPVSAMPATETPIAGE